MAWAAAKFTDALLRAMTGEKDIIIPTFVESPLFTDKVINPNPLSGANIRDVISLLPKLNYPRMVLARSMDSEILRTGKKNY